MLNDRDLLHVRAGLLVVESHQRSGRLGRHRHLDCAVELFESDFLLPSRRHVLLRWVIELTGLQLCLRLILSLGRNPLHRARDCRLGGHEVALIVAPVRSTLHGRG